jgi:hypothetical protein
MAIATIHEIFCASQATGVDGPAFLALAKTASRFVPADFEPLGLGISDGIRSMPAVILAIDTVRDDPDDFFVTLVTKGDVDSRVWPAETETVPMRAGQSVSPQLEAEFDFSQNVSLWDYDSLTRNDLLGSITISAEEVGQGLIAKKATSQIEKSVYYVIYSVD